MTAMHTGKNLPRGARKWIHHPDSREPGKPNGEMPPGADAATLVSDGCTSE